MKREGGEKIFQGAAACVSGCFFLDSPGPFVEFLVVVVVGTSELCNNVFLLLPSCLMIPCC